MVLKGSCLEEVVLAVSQSDYSAAPGRFSSLKHLCFQIWRKHNHVNACYWIVACVILHNMALEHDNPDGLDYFVGKGKESMELGNGHVTQAAVWRHQELRKELEAYLELQVEDGRNH
jgi:hypothetical protein